MTDRVWTPIDLVNAAERYGSDPIEVAIAAPLAEETVCASATKARPCESPILTARTVHAIGRSGTEKVRVRPLCRVHAADLLAKVAGHVRAWSISIATESGATARSEILERHRHEVATRRNELIVRAQEAAFDTLPVAIARELGVLA